MNIRRAETRDVDGIMKLLVQVNNVHHENRPDLFLKGKTKYTEKELLDIIQDDEKPIFVAVDGEWIKGYAFGVFQSHVKDNNFTDIVTFYIDDICVDENCRGEHVGTSIYQYVKDYAKTQGCYNITLNVWEDNDTAKKFYESCGFGVQKYGLEVVL